MSQSKYIYYRLKAYVLKIIEGNPVFISYTTVSSTRYIWYINDNWFFVITLRLSTSLSYLVRVRREKMEKKNKNLNTPRGGSGLGDCIKSDKVYEIVDEDLKRIIQNFIKDEYLKEFLKKMFLPDRPLVVTPFVFFIAFANRSHLATQLDLLGVE